MKKTLLRLLTFLLSIITSFAYVLPTFAVIESNEKTDSSTTPIESINESLITTNGVKNTTSQTIIKEIEEKRTEFTKVFLLSDGNFCNITTTNPIHKKAGNSWEEINDNVSISEPSTISEYTNEIASCKSSAITKAKVSSRNISNTQTLSQGVIINPLDSETALGGGVVFTDNPVTLLKPSSVDEYIYRNMAIVDAKLSIYCSSTPTNESQYIYLSEETSFWNSETSADDYDFDSVSNKRVMDYTAISETGTYTWDITDIYSRWERGITPNNGLILHGSINNEIILSDFCFIVIYKEISPLDNDFTYHTIDMEKAGIMYINDFSNTVTIEQDILDIENSILPISIKRSYTSVSPSFSSGAGIGFSWNYESSISLNNNLLTWNLFDGTTKYFVPTNPAVINGEYQKWTEVTDGTYSDNLTEAWIKSSEITNASNGYTVNYSNLKINIDKTIYSFNSSGNLIRVLESSETPFNVESNIGKSLVITYNNAGNITNIKDSENRNYVFTYARNNTGYTHISDITVKNAENEVINFTNSANVSIPYKINFSTSYSQADGIVSQTTTFEDNTSVTFKYDIYGNLFEIINIDGSKHSLSYKFSDSTHKNNILNSYEKTSPNGDNTYKRVDYLKIYNQNTYQRYFSTVEHVNETCNNCNNVFCVYNTAPKELLQYDRHFNIITHKDSNGNSVFARYNSSNIIEAFAINENISTEKELLKNASFDDSRLGKWSKVGPETLNRRASTMHESGKELYFNGRIDVLTAAQQIVTPENGFSKNSVYVTGAKAKASTAIPFEERFFGIRVYASNIVDGLYDVDNEELIVEEAFDTAVIGEWQEKLVAFQLPNDYDSLKIMLVFTNQQGEVTFEDATLYETTNAVVDPTDAVDFSPIIYTYNTDGSLYSEMLTNGTNSIGITYDEYLNGFVAEKTDYNGIKNYYEYDESGNILKSGTNKIGSTITNATNYVYEGSAVLSEISKTITSIENADLKNISTQYNRANGLITQVAHNGFLYDFTYDDKNNITNVQRIYGEETNNYANYSYEDSTLNEVVYANNNIVSYEYDEVSGNITSITISKIENDERKEIKTYEYEYNDHDNLISIIDDSVNVKTEYTDNEIIISKIVSDNEQSVLYTYRESIGGTYETYFPELYVTTDADSNNIPLNTVSKESTTLVTDYDGNTTRSASIDATVSNSNNSNNPYIYNYNFYDVTDCFNRKINKDVFATSVKEENEQYNLKIGETYSYKMLNETTGLTSGLIAQQNSYIGSIDENGNIDEYYSNLTYLYEYDSNGNITSIIIDNGNGDTLPYAFYGYDEANQITYEINYYLDSAIHYTYDAGGNMIQKLYYDINDVLTYDEANKEFDISSWFTEPGIISTDEFNELNSLISTINFQYSNDALISYNNHIISKDALCNPTYYYGADLLGNAVEGHLVWSGSQLTQFYNNEIKLEFEYDTNGYRTLKRSYESNGTDAGGNITYELIQEYMYVWENGLLKSTIIGTNTNTPSQMTIIYDNDNLPIGIISPIGVALYYQKDIHGNVIGLLTDEGEQLVDIYYDAWGNFAMNLHGSNALAQAVNAILVAFNPCMYHGYLYDYELGMYFNKGRCYSPTLGRYLNAENPTKLLNPIESPIESNLFLFCNNNAVNQMDTYGSWSQNFADFKWTSTGFEVNSSRLFLSKAFSSIFANEIIEKKFNFSSDIGSNYMNMNSLYIASNLYAHSLAKYHPDSINEVLGEGWIEQANNQETITVIPNDSNSWRYKRLWFLK